MLALKDNKTTECLFPTREHENDCKSIKCLSNFDASLNKVLILCECIINIYKIFIL